MQILRSLISQCKKIILRTERCIGNCQSLLNEAACHFRTLLGEKGKKKHLKGSRTSEGHKPS